MKQRHHLTSDKPLTAADLRAFGLEPEQLLADHVTHPEAAGLLLTGSLAEGLGTPASDIDLMVLLGKKSELRRRRDDLQFEDALFSERLFYVNGVEVNVEFARRKEMAGVMAAMLSLAPALYDPLVLTSIPLLGGPEHRFLHRLRSGVVLHGADQCAQWRDEFLVDMLPLYLAARHFMEVSEYLEDALAQRDVDSDSAAHMLRIATEELLISTLALCHITTPSRKWLVANAKRAQRTCHPALAAVLKGGLALLFAPWSDDLQARFARLTELHHALLKAMSHDGQLGTAVTFLKKKISYVLD